MRVLFAVGAGLGLFMFAKLLFGVRVTDGTLIAYGTGSLVSGMLVLASALEAGEQSTRQRLKRQRGKGYCI